MEENIRVVVRVRPLNKREAKKGETICVTRGNSPKEIQIHTGPQLAQAYSCNRLFPSDTTQSEFFTHSGIPSLLDSVIGGFHACSFAFGQTGAGKTYTCTGPTQGIKLNSEGDGVMGRSLQYLFDKLNSLGVGYKMKMACMEIYHENVFDLSLPEQSKTPLVVREHPEKGFFAEGCKQVQVMSVDSAVSVLEHAIKLRHTGSHEMNARSNRSHFMTEVFLELSGDSVDSAKQAKGAGATGIFGDLKSKLEGDQDFDILGKMTFIDLAGSERLKATKSSGQMVSDTGFINKSLYVLGKVIAGLVRGAGEGNIEVPFRESKLTKLLINSLGGKCRTLLISCVSEASGSIHETLRTLKFSMTAAKIKNRPVRFLDPQEKLILDLRDEIKRLKEENKFLIVSLMSNPPPMGDVPTAPTAILASPRQEEEEGSQQQQYSQSDNTGMAARIPPSHTTQNSNGNIDYSEYTLDEQHMRDRGHTDLTQGKPVQQVPQPVRNKALKKLNAGHKSKAKKKPSPYLHGNNAEAQLLLAAMMHGGKVGSPAKLSTKINNGMLGKGYGNLARYEQQQQRRTNDNNVAAENPLKSLREKLAILKFELEEKRQYMEDNPGTVTEAGEIQLNDLEREVKEMHLELKAVSSLESLSTDHSQGAVPGFPVGIQSEYPLPVFEKEKPTVPSYSAVDMSNKKVYDNRTPGNLQKVNSLTPLPVSVADAAIKANKEKEEKAYVNRKQHLDAYINGKKQLNSLPSSSKPKQNGNGNKSAARNINKLTPLEDKPMGKGFNSSQARALNYPGRKQEEVNQLPKVSKKNSTPTAVTSMPVAMSFPRSSNEDSDSVPIAIHSTLKKKDVSEAKRPTVVGNPSDDSVFGINSAFDSRFENLMTPLPSMGSGQMDPYGMSEKMPAILPSTSTKRVTEESVESTGASSSVNNNNNNSIGSPPEATPEHNSNDDAEDEHGYSDDGFEEAYDDDDFED